MPARTKWDKLTLAQQHKVLEGLDRTIAELRGVRKTIKRSKATKADDAR